MADVILFCFSKGNYGQLYSNVRFYCLSNSLPLQAYSRKESRSSGSRSSADLSDHRSRPMRFCRSAKRESERSPSNTGATLS